MAVRRDPDASVTQLARRGNFLRPDAPSFTPVTASAPTLGRKSVPCRFFLLGACKRGGDCAFSHQGLSQTPQDDGASLARVDQSVAQLAIADPLPTGNLQHSLISNVSLKVYKGAMVRFGSGAEVEAVKFPSDFSTIHIFGLPIGASAEDIVRLLQDLGFSVLQSCVQIKPLGIAGPVAEVKAEDAKFAEAATNKFDQESRRGKHQGLSIKPALVNASSAGTLTNKLRMSSVTCTWYAASRVAWLQYRHSDIALRAEKILNDNPRILKRKIECSIQHPPPYAKRDRIWSIQVSNLDVLTRQGHFYHILTGDEKPHKVVLGKPSYSLSDTEASKFVESLLQSKGDLESFQCHIIPGSVKMKATATFMDRSQAVKAVQSLNNHKLEVLGNSRLFVAHLISIKYSVLNVIFDSIGPQLSQLRDGIWQSGHVHLKTYPSQDITKPLTTIRVFGEDSKRVAEAKSALEKLLAGSIVMNGDTTVWDPSFSTPAAVAYLEQLSIESKLYIHRDMRKRHLIMYGGLANHQVAVQQTLIAKMESLKRLTHTIILTSELLPRAMKGGWRRIKERFGEAAVLDISRQPKTIVIRGSAENFQLAEGLLLQTQPAPKDLELAQGEIICPVCWEEATEPLRMPCGHNYCKDCFSLQAASAEDSSFPICCCGGEGKCLHVFGLDELNTMLSRAAFEKLLESSFDTYVRMHPQEFQHCPSPDCPNVYRLSTDGSIVVCSACLMPTCTTCNVISHDDMSCTEFKYLNSEGNRAFEAWKKENDVRNCPKCSSPIEKSFGCNHMECFHCKAHICWVCMEVFTQSSECYRHMGSVHKQMYAN